MKTDLIYQPATSEQVDEFLELMRLEAADYLEQTMKLSEMTWSQFSKLVKTMGQVFCVTQKGKIAGYYWTEERGKIVHLHGIVIRSEYQGQGIGSEVLSMLVRKYSGIMDAIELGVHASNTRAKKLYEKMGYQTVKYMPDLRFYILQCPLEKKL